MNRAERQRKIELLELLDERDRRKKAGSTVVGIVDPIKGLTHAMTNKGGEWIESQAEPDVYLPAKLERVLKSGKRYIVMYGGRGSSKSVSGVDICAVYGKDSGDKTYCLREFQSSIKNSVYSLLCDEIERLGFGGQFQVQATSVLGSDGNDLFQFAGLSRNTDSIKSAHGFKRYMIEEAQFLSQESLDILTPTARNKPKKGLPGQFTGEDAPEAGVSMIFVANPGSEQDPFSQKFIVPYQTELDRDGFYEDGLRLIVKMNYYDNPWFKDSGLEADRVDAYNTMPRALYDHIWEGAYNDSVEGSIILAEWFDACVDAHIKLGFKPRGAKIASHDPSDTGPDSKGYVMRHGCVVLDVQEKLTGNINEGGDWATGLANEQKVDYFTWDCDGMGVGLNRQISADFKGKRVDIVMFKGSEGPDNPNAIYKPAVSSPVKDQKLIKDVMKNKRAQYYSDLRDRIYRTYRAVVHGDYFDPDDLISFDSSIALLNKLRSELCRMPIKPNGSGLVDLYTKLEMVTKFKFASPNLGDSLMMSMRFKQETKTEVHMPRRLKTMGGGR